MDRDKAEQAADVLRRLQSVEAVIWYLNKWGNVPINVGAVGILEFSGEFKDDFRKIVLRHHDLLEKELKSLK